jgi:hypothetical protein
LSSFWYSACRWQVKRTHNHTATTAVTTIIRRTVNRTRGNLIGPTSRGSSGKSVRLVTSSTSDDRAGRNVKANNQSYSCGGSTARRNSGSFPLVPASVPGGGHQQVTARIAPATACNAAPAAPRLIAAKGVCPSAPWPKHRNNVAKNHATPPAAAPAQPPRNSARPHQTRLSWKPRQTIQPARLPAEGLTAKAMALPAQTRPALFGGSSSSKPEKM